MTAPPPRGRALLPPRIVVTPAQPAQMQVHPPNRSRHSSVGRSRSPSPQVRVLSSLVVSELERKQQQLREMQEEMADVRQVLRRMLQQEEEDAAAAASLDAEEPSVPCSHLLNGERIYRLEDAPFNIKYKTTVCRHFEEKGRCPLGEHCQFAHGPAELRCMRHHPNYKTRDCSSYKRFGRCAHQAQCFFVHEEAERRPKPADALSSILDDLCVEGGKRQKLLQVLKPPNPVRSRSLSPAAKPFHPTDELMDMISRRDAEACLLSPILSAGIWENAVFHFD